MDSRANMLAIKQKEAVGLGKHKPTLMCYSSLMRQPIKQRITSSGSTGRVWRADSAESDDVKTKRENHHGYAMTAAPGTHQSSKLL